MATRRPIKYQLIQIDVSAAGASGSTSGVNTDKQYERVTGIQVTATDADGLENSVFTKFEIDGQEIYPNGFEAKLIACGEDVNPNERFDNDIDEPAANSVVDISYTDGGSAAGAYVLNVYLRLENRDENLLVRRNKLIDQLFSTMEKLKSDPSKN